MTYTRAEWKANQVCGDGAIAAMNAVNFHTFRAIDGVAPCPDNSLWLACYSHAERASRFASACLEFGEEVRQ